MQVIPRDKRGGSRGFLAWIQCRFPDLRGRFLDVPSHGRILATGEARVVGGRREAHGEAARERTHVRALTGRTGTSRIRNEHPADNECPAEHPAENELSAGAVLRMLPAAVCAVRPCEGFSGRLPRTQSAHPDSGKKATKGAGPFL